MRDAIEFKDVHFAYSNQPESLRGIDVAVREGSKVALVGPNGAGKTTLLLMCNGMLRPTRGEVQIGEVPVQYDTRSLREVRRKVGLVFQNSDTQLFAPTVWQDVAFGPLNLGMGKHEINETVGRALHQVGMNGYEKRPPHHLSGGEKKRVAIAGVLAMDPEVLVFDEPTSALDPATAEEVMDLLDELNHEGRTILLSTHDVELAYRWADEVVLMEDGAVLRHGSPEAIFSDPALLHQARLKPPAVLDLYQELSDRGYFKDKTPPRSALEFTDLVEGLADGRPTQDRRGTIHLWDAAGTDNTALATLLSSGTVARVGAMGTRAKRRASEEGIVLDFTYGVIDKCLLRAVAGEDSLILTTGGMLAHTRERIATYARESGREIQIRAVGRDPHQQGDSGTEHRERCSNNEIAPDCRQSKREDNINGMAG
ncbi:cobalt/nickel transport system ATP-binding protein [Methanofollis sp. W23]|uniref:energy-coupling factor ABC transporter ATP-binding protein n=1 Tax=Methanofollis sp. W23 TaxID=2817849 RepID=UPI001AE7FAD6|nr:ATP-binding cassette domain-containing protein [Methanofollis sp. W23]MBP2146054.1 cobalt/nickel transport system ATP-binding protein [Methanofollis sp. W23]